MDKTDKDNVMTRYALLISIFSLIVSVVSAWINIREFNGDRRANEEVQSIKFTGIYSYNEKLTLTPISTEYNISLNDLNVYFPQELNIEEMKVDNPHYFLSLRTVKKSLEELLTYNRNMIAESDNECKVPIIIQTKYLGLRGVGVCNALYYVGYSYIVHPVEYKKNPSITFDGLEFVRFLNITKNCYKELEQEWGEEKKNRKFI